MNDDNKVVNQNTPPVVPVDQVQPQAQVQPVVPVGTVHKEMGPPIAVVSEIKPAGAEVQHEINQESAELGVKEIQDRPDLIKGVDMQHAGPSVPVPTSPSGKVTMPMSEKEITDKLKTGQDDDSGKWLSKLIQKIMKVMGL